MRNLKDYQLGKSNNYSTFVFRKSVTERNIISHKVGGQGGTQCLFRQEDTLCLPQARRINFIRSDEVSTLSIAKPISRTGRSGDDVISATSDDAEIKIDETNSTVNIDNAAISDGAGKNIIAVETDGSTTIGDNSLKITDVSGTLDIQDGAGKTVIKTMSDGSTHIGENSLVTVEQNGRQYLYGTDVNGDMIDIDIKAGSDFRIHGISVLDSLKGLGDGVEVSAALTAALSSVPSSAPDYEYYCGGGLGAYGSSQAAALGCAKDHNETLSFHSVASYLLGGGKAYGVDEFSDFAFKAGFTYKFGKKSKSNPGESASVNAAALSASSKVEQTKLKAQVNDLSHKLAISTVEQTKLKVQASDLNHKLALMEKKLEVITASLNFDSHMDKVAMAR